MTSSKTMQDYRLINIDCHHNHETIKIKLITCKQQNIRKTENTTNEEQQHLQCLMMINCPLLWHSAPVQSLIALHPLGYSFIQTSI
jgi:hypothetical protein